MDLEEERQRRRHLKRRELDGGIGLTECDLAILYELFENRFMHTRQLQALFGERVFRRLHVLFHHGYVDRPLAQRAWRLREGGGSRPIVYALSNRGAKALVEGGLIERSGRDFTERNRDLASFSLTIPHELLVADVRVAFQRACTRRGLEMLHVDALAQRQNARALNVPERDKPLYPDWIFGIARESAEPNLFFVEVDRGTEPNERHGSPQMQSLWRKFEGYLGYARGKRSLEQFGVRGFRVLTIVSVGETKVRNVAEIAGEVCSGGPNRFLVTSFAALEAGDPLEIAWVNAEGEEVRLGM